MRSTTLFCALLGGIGGSVGAQLQQQPLAETQHHSGIQAAAETVVAPSDASAPPYREALLNLHRNLIETESVSGRENGVGNFLVDFLAAKGYMTQLDFVPPRDNTPPSRERFNVLAWPSPQRKPSPRLLVTSHIDTVPPFIPYSIDSRSGTVDNETVIHGRGSVDAKASVASQIVAVEDLLASGKANPEDIMLLYVVGEEVTGDGMLHISETLQKLDPPVTFEAAIFGEPTEGKLACGHKGILGCTATAKGKAGHSGYPWLGKSANELMVRALAKVLDTDLGSSELFGNTTVNIGTLVGGVASNVIPENASAKLSIRIATGPEVGGSSKVESRLQEIFARVDDDALAVECEQGYGAVESNCDVEGFETIVVNYGTDIPHLSGNHTRYLYGPGTIMVAHSDHEAITVGELETAVEGYKTLIAHALDA